MSLKALRIQKKYRHHEKRLPQCTLEMQQVSSGKGQRRWFAAELVFEAAIGKNKRIEQVVHGLEV
jgi:hypothetical protein